MILSQSSQKTVSEEMVMMMTIMVCLYHFITRYREINLHIIKIHHPNRGWQRIDGFYSTPELK